MSSRRSASGCKEAGVRVLGSTSRIQACSSSAANGSQLRSSEPVVLDAAANVIGLRSAIARS